MHAAPALTEQERTLSIAQEAIAWVRSHVIAANDPRNRVERIFAERSHFDVILETRERPEGIDTTTYLADRMARTVEEHAGNCGEMAITALAYIQKNYPDQELKFCDVPGDDHAFVVLRSKSLSRSKGDAEWVLCDPWLDIACPWMERTEPLMRANQAFQVGALHYLDAYRHKMQEPGLSPKTIVAASNVLLTYSNIAQRYPEVSALAERQLESNPRGFFKWARDTPAPGFSDASILDILSKAYQESWYYVIERMHVQASQDMVFQALPRIIAAIETKALLAPALAESVSAVEPTTYITPIEPFSAEKLSDFFKLLCEAYRLEVATSGAFKVELWGKCLFDLGAHHLGRINVWRAAETVTAAEVDAYLQHAPIKAGGALDRTFVFAAKALLEHQEHATAEIKPTAPVPER